MNKVFVLLLVPFFFLPIKSYSSSIEGVHFSDTEKIDDSVLKLNGLGLRTATLFKVKVYAAGLYLLEQKNKPEMVATISNPKLLIMKFMRDVSRDKINDAWDKAFEETGTKFKAELRQLKNLMPNAKEGDVLEYVFLDDRTEFKLNHSLKGTLPGGEWGKILLQTWIGNNPPTEELKKGLLGIKE